MSAHVTIVQDAGMRWLHSLMVFIPLLIGTQGAASRFDPPPPEAVETQPADGLRTVIAPDDPQDSVLAGKRAGMPFT
ncbi:hypothetical protein BON30_17990 [Cystobacter ferrugineus]|uniref:Uncharacterized protein n=1 Tax=Cystobacter ferrugineus TaxID=83449 RepID=A0A1L9BAV7_9BACT|nr:hypothetical protein BON30_17990 [Cystobacter ferrugineus]